MAQWIRRLSPEEEIPGSSPGGRTAIACIFGRHISDSDVCDLILIRCAQIGAETKEKICIHPPSSPVATHSFAIIKPQHLSHSLSCRCSYHHFALVESALTRWVPGGNLACVPDPTLRRAMARSGRLYFCCTWSCCAPQAKRLFVVPLSKPLSHHVEDVFRTL